MWARKCVLLHAVPETDSRDLFTFLRREECPVFHWGPPNLQAQGGDSLGECERIVELCAETRPKSSGLCSNSASKPGVRVPALSDRR